MPYTPLTHEQLREKVCAVCYGRSGSKATKLVNEKLESVIKSLVFEDYSRVDEKFPSGLCLICFFTLRDHVSGQNTKHKAGAPRMLLIPDTEEYETQVRRATRASSDKQCQCRICAIGRMNGLEWRRFAIQCKKDTIDKTGPVARFLKVCRYDQFRRNSCYDKLGCNSLVVTVMLLRPA